MDQLPPPDCTWIFEKKWELVVNSFFGGQRRINPSSDLDEATLRKISAITDGQYFRARDTQELEQIYGILNELEPLAEEAEYYRPTKELFVWPLAAVLMTLLLTLWLREPS